MDPTRSAAIAEKVRDALANVVTGIHRFGGVPMSAAAAALDYAEHGEQA